MRDAAKMNNLAASLLLVLLRFAFCVLHSAVDEGVSDAR